MRIQAMFFVIILSSPAAAQTTNTPSTWDFFATPGDMPLEIERKVQLSLSSEWIGVDPTKCALVEPKVKITYGKAEFTSDASEPSDASRIELLPDGTLFALKKILGVASSISCANVTGLSARLNNATYTIELPGNYIGNNDYECQKKGILPVVTTHLGKVESTWKRDFCSIQRFGLATGEPSVAWAGDLDGDKKLDLLLRLPSHPMAASYMLLLSKQVGRNILFQYERPGNPGC